MDKKAEVPLKQKTGMSLFHGTLNLKLEKTYKLKDNIIVLSKEEYGGTLDVLIKQCKVNGHKSYIIRTKKAEEGNGDHPLDIIEIVSDINFRKVYNLKDDDKVLIEI